MYILSSDYDGTLFVDNRVSEENIEAIKRFQEAGNLFIINTGRNIKDIKNQVKNYDIDVDFFIGSNGSIIADNTDNIIYKADFDRGLAKEIVDYFEEHLRDEVFYIASNDGFDIGIKRYYETFDFDKTWAIDLDESLKNEIITMFSQVRDGANCGQIVKELNEHFDGRAIFFNTDPFIDIVETNNDKATALAQMQSILASDLDGIYTVGDNRNDLAMLKAYQGYAMDNSEDHIKIQADGVVKSVADLINMILAQGDKE